MLTIFSHAGHSHESMDTMSAIDHCMPVIIGAGIIIVVLLGVITYLLTNWQPKKAVMLTEKQSPKK